MGLTNQASIRAAKKASCEDENRHTKYARLCITLLFISNWFDVYLSLRGEYEFVVYMTHIDHGHCSVPAPSSLGEPSPPASGLDLPAFLRRAILCLIARHPHRCRQERKRGRGWPRRPPPPLPDRPQAFLGYRRIPTVWIGTSPAGIRSSLYSPLARGPAAWSCNPTPPWPWR